MTSAQAPRLAATVMLLRDGQSGLEVFVLDRVAGMVFAPSVTVFPGGGVDPTDGEETPWSGPDRSWWASSLGTDETRAGALVVAAARELFEETGVLLADHPAPEVLSRELQELTEHRRSFADVLREHGLRLRSELLRPWANWITPAGHTRRYDTFFFAAALPGGQQARLLTTEAGSAAWARPKDLLARHAAGRQAMMAPTVAMLSDLADAGSLDGVLSAHRRLSPVAPRVLSEPGQPVQVEVAGRVYPSQPEGR